MVDSFLLDAPGLDACETSSAGEARGAAEDAMACALLEGQIVHATQLPPAAFGSDRSRPALRQDLTCLYCGGPVYVRGARFAHAPGHAARTQSCERSRRVRLRRGGETDWHRGAKEVLVGLPDVARATGMQVPAMVRGGLELAPARRLQGLEVLALEARLGRVRLDALLHYHGQPLGVEITVTHALNLEKLQEAARLGLALLEIDLRDLRHQPWDAAIAREVVIEGLYRKRWHLPPA